MGIIYDSNIKWGMFDVEEMGLDGMDSLSESIGFIGFLLCPHCLKTKKIRFKSSYTITTEEDDGGETSEFLINEEISKVWAEPELYGSCKCGYEGDFSLIDPLLIHTVLVFNMKGWTTRYCCQGHKELYKGHSENVSPYIRFDDDELEDTHVAILEEEIKKYGHIKFDNDSYEKGYGIDIIPIFNCMHDPNSWDKIRGEFMELAYSLPKISTNETDIESQGYSIVYISLADEKLHIAGRFDTKKEKENFLKEVRSFKTQLMVEEINTILVINDKNFILPS